ncbi:hypothetical protein [Alicyclobacillus macrosporangiidus]|uniref:Uncharacterized protein n=1 Tax=Alicyclobacillus macrosporangiidus TaxID=392015 RepID=A0A1I7KFE4_9BACL|nr:hypothetical protein [Alicyclobacillus macrosporangiidus]SFU96162.1 hypothetical protein SAMN05421543_115101 [Alicyclobacillus macrosporangiidus]
MPQVRFFDRLKFRCFLRGMSVRASLEEITGRGWIFVAVIVGVIMVFGPQAIALVKDHVGSSLNTVSQNYNFNY